MTTDRRLKRGLAAVCCGFTTHPFVPFSRATGVLASQAVKSSRGWGGAGAGPAVAVARCEGPARTAAPCAQGEALLAAAPRSPHLRRHTMPAALIHTAACRLGEIHLQLQVTRAVAARPCPCAHTHSGAHSSTGASYGRAPVPDGAPSRPRARV